MVLGAAKTNIAHLEGSAGIAGFLKHLGSNLLFQALLPAESRFRCNHQPAKSGLRCIVGYVDIVSLLPNHDAAADSVDELMVDRNKV